MNNNYIYSLIEKDLRVDERKFDQYREISIEYGISGKSAEGSARVKIGDTEVVAGVKMDLGTPFPDTPNDGVLIVNAELISLASPEFESGPPGINSIEIARVVDRGIRESHVIDTEKLCVKKGEKVWMVYIDIYPINDAGNLFDAAALAAIAALKDAKMPSIKDDKIDYGKHDKSLPLNKIPTECTIVNIGSKFLVDPTNEEEKTVEARLTVASVGDNICAMQKGGEKELSIEEIDVMVELALKKNKELREYIK